MASQTGEAMATVDPATFAADVAEEAFVDATAEVVAQISAAIIPAARRDP